MATCANGECTLERNWCDCQENCLDGSDESNCTNSDCHRCADTGTVYPADRRCDCSEDCADGSDEENCDDDPLNKRFECGDGIECTRNSLRCDEYEHCSNGRDEENCTSKKVEKSCISNSSYHASCGSATVFESSNYPDRSKNVSVVFFINFHSYLNISGFFLLFLKRKIGRKLLLVIRVYVLHHVTGNTCMMVNGYGPGCGSKPAA